MKLVIAIINSGVILDTIDFLVIFDTFGIRNIFIPHWIINRRIIFLYVFFVACIKANEN